MRKYLVAIIVFVASYGKMSGEPNWQLVWSDEFNYNGLPDPAKWDYEVGYLRNHEKQYYMHARMENSRVENGMLVIECRKEWATLRSGFVVKYTSASLFARNTPNTPYGRIEVKAKLPDGKGVWPAIWTLGSNFWKVGWPKCGEIDIVEYVGNEPGAINANTHFLAEGKHEMKHGSLKIGNPTDDFHVYAINWYPDRIDYFFDDRMYHSVNLNSLSESARQSLRQPQRLIINFALGGSWGGPIDDTALPQKFLIDYVRIYKDMASN